MGTQRWKVITLLIILAGAALYLWPTYRYYFGLSPEERSSRNPSSEVVELREKILHLGLDLQGGMHVVLETELDEDAESGSAAVDRVVEVLRNRVDKFGVSEPVIQKQGDRRIVVDLAGLKDPEAARRLIGSTARLEFRMCKSAAEASQILDRVDKYLAAVAVDSTDTKPLSSKLAVFYQRDLGVPTGAFVRGEAKAEVEAILADAQVDSVVGAGADLALGTEEFNLGQYTGYVLYFLDRAFSLTGDQIRNASVGFDLDPSNPGAPGISLTFTGRGARKFGELTSENVGNFMAIVLDDKVQSAPRINEAIRGGRASINGSFTDKEAQVLATVLQAGALPVDVKIIEERTVGASLGQDSVRKGLKAGLIGAAAVVVFVILWYKLSGVIAVVALTLNILLVFAGLSMLRGTLTLPGIAGIVLTIGMAVDANVLVFERIREELRNGKTARAAIDAGYGRAFTTIMDSNLTTLIAALVLFQYGTGPIRGFAITLSIGIIANLFTAVVVTRMLFDAIYRRSTAATVSI